jgi:uncharacterized Zn finger protein
VFLSNSPLSSKTSTHGSEPCRSTRSESVESKAARYLAEGRVKVRVVTPDRVEADVRGSNDAIYTTTRKGRRWACDCPAWQCRCSHVIAVELVT